MKIQKIKDHKFFVPADLASILGYETDIIVQTEKVKDNPAILRSDDDKFFVGNIDAFKTPSKKEQFYMETGNGIVLINFEKFFIVGRVKTISVCEKTDYEKVLDDEFSEFLENLDDEFSGIKIKVARSLSPDLTDAPTLADIPHSRPARKHPKTKKNANKTTRERFDLQIKIFPAGIQPETIQENKMNNNAETNKITFQEANEESLMDYLEAAQLMKDIASQTNYEPFVLYGLFFLFSSLEKLLELDKTASVGDILSWCQSSLYAESQSGNAGYRRLSKTIHLIYKKVDFTERNDGIVSDHFINIESLTFQKVNTETPFIPNADNVQSISDVPHSKPSKNRTSKPPVIKRVAKPKKQDRKDTGVK